MNRRLHATRFCFLIEFILSHTHSGYSTSLAVLCEPWACPNMARCACMSAEHGWAFCSRAANRAHHLPTIFTISASGGKYNFFEKLGTYTLELQKKTFFSSRVVKCLKKDILGTNYSCKHIKCDEPYLFYFSVDCRSKNQRILKEQTREI